MIYLTRKDQFNAAHKMCNPVWSAEKNKEVFGKCANENWHGHNFELYVTVKGEINPETGLIINPTELTNLINLKVIDKLDHKNLNLDVDFMKDKMASTENLILEIWNLLVNEISEMGATLHKLNLVETKNNSVEYYGN